MHAFRRLCGSSLALALLLTGCGKQESEFVVNPPAATKAPVVTSAPATPAAKPLSAEEALYAQTFRDLDTGGDMVVYLNTEGLVETVMAFATNLAGMATAGAADKDMVEINAALGRADTFLRQSGAFDLQAFGMSSKARGDGLYNLRSRIVRKPSTAGGPSFWAMNGTAPRELKLLAYAPADSVLASTSTLDLPQAWMLIRKGVADIGGAKFAAELEKTLAELKTKQGYDLEALVNSLGDEILVSVQLSSKRQTSFPMGPEPVMMPEPSALLAIAVKDDSALKLLLKAFENPLKATVEDAGGAQMHILARMGDPSMPLQPAILQKDGVLFVASNPDTLREALAAQAGHNGLVAQEAFKKLLSAPLGPCNGVTYISDRFYKTLHEIQAKSIGASGTDAKQLAMMEKMQQLYQQGPMLAVSTVLPDGVKGTTVSSTSGRAMLASLAVAPVGLMAAIAVPSFVNARSKSQANACINNLRMISGSKDQYALDHNNKAPASMNDLLPYLRRPPVCPAGGVYRIGPLDVDPTCSRSALGGHTI